MRTVARHPPRGGRPGPRRSSAAPPAAPSAVPERGPPRHRLGGVRRPRPRACGPPRRGSTRVAATGRRARGSRTTTAGRFLSSAVNGLIGDRLARERPRLAIPMARARATGATCRSSRTALAAAFPRPTGRLVVFLHGLCENECLLEPRPRRASARRTPRRWPSAGWTPVFLRANTGLALRENGVALAALLQRPGRGLAGRGHPDRPGRPLDGRPDHARRRRGGHRGRAAVDRPGHRRGHPRHPAPRRPARRRRRPRQPRRSAGCPRPRRSAGSSTGARSACTTSSTGLAEDVAAAAARALPPGRGDADQLAAAPGRARRRATCWCGSRRRTAATGTAPSCSRAPTCCTSAGTDHFGLLNHPEVHARPARLAGLRPGRRAAASTRICCRRTAGDQPWKCRPFRLGSLS